MHTVRNTLLILFAIFIDLLQACLSAAFFVMGAFPGTVAGAAGGCLLGHQVAGQIGCWIGGVVTGIVGSAANGAAVATLPLAVGLGFAVNFCIDITLGLVLTAFLVWLGIYSKGIGISGFITELVPGLSNIPGWTFMTILCVMKKNAEEKKLTGQASGTLFSAFASSMSGAGAVAAFALNTSGTRRAAPQRGGYTQEEQGVDTEEKKQFVSTELKNIDGIRAATKNQTSQQTRGSYAI